MSELMRRLRLAVVLAAAATGLAAKASYPVVLNPPRWSWHTLGHMAFLHAGDSQPYTPTDLVLVNRFPLVQFDKKQSLARHPTLSQEDRFILAAKQVRTYFHVSALPGLPRPGRGWWVVSPACLCVAAPLPLD